MNKEHEIRRLLGNRFHLCMSYKIGKNPEWHLFRNYEDSRVYFSLDNEEIMSSKTHTIDDLYDFAKKHHKIDEHQVILKTATKISFIFLIFLIVNMIFIHSNFIRSFILGADFIMILNSMICHYVWNKNHNVKMMELMENLERISNENKEKINDRKSSTK